MSELVDGFLNQLRVVHALALRETRTRFGAHKLGYLWALLEPLFWIGTFAGFFWILDREAPNHMAVVPFLATGIIPYELVLKNAEKGSQAIAGNKALLFYPQVKLLDLVFARGALEMATYGVVFTVIIGGWALTADRVQVDDLLHLTLGLVLAGLLGMALGMVLCALSVVSTVVDRIRGPLFRPLFWVSGLFFTAENLPTQLRSWFLWNPILHCVEMVRDGFFPAYDSRHTSVPYVLAWIVVLLFFGLTLLRGVERKVELT